MNFFSEAALVAVGAGVGAAGGPGVVAGVAPAKMFYVQIVYHSLGH